MKEVDDNQPVLKSEVKAFEAVELDNEGRAKTSNGFESIKARGWLLTLPADEYTKEVVESRLSRYSYIGQLERGKTKSVANPEGYLHWQIYIEVENAVRASTLKKKFPKGHFEVRRGSVQQAYNYCSKSDTREGEPFANGDISVFLEKSMKLRDYVDLIERGMTVTDIITSYPMSVIFERQLSTLQKHRRMVEAKVGRRDLQVHYLWGKSGVGKTHSIYEKYGYANVFMVSDYKNPFDGYDGESVLVFDEFRSQIQVSIMLKLLDPYPTELSARFNNSWAAYNTVYVVSNIPLEGQFPNVKATEPETWQAFRNRFDSVSEKQGKNHREEKRRTQNFLDWEMLNNEVNEENMLN